MQVINLPEKPSNHELDFLAGTWTIDDAYAFMENTKFFETIDEDLWK